MVVVHSPEIPRQRGSLRERFGRQYHLWRIDTASRELRYLNRPARISGLAQERVWKQEDPSHQSLNLYRLGNGIMYRLKRTTPAGGFDHVQISCWRDGSTVYHRDVFSESGWQVGSEYFSSLSEDAAKNTADLAQVNHDMNRLVSLARYTERQQLTDTTPLVVPEHL